jgi:hypothetical protein
MLLNDVFDLNNYAEYSVWRHRRIAYCPNLRQCPVFSKPGTLASKTAPQWPIQVGKLMNYLKQL